MGQKEAYDYPPRISTKFRVDVTKMPSDILGEAAHDLSLIERHYRQVKRDLGTASFLEEMVHDLRRGWISGRQYDFLLHYSPVAKRYFEKDLLLKSLGN